MLESIRSGENINNALINVHIVMILPLSLNMCAEWRVLCLLFEFGHGLREILLFYNLAAGKLSVQPSG